MKEMGMTSSHRRFILHCIQEWKINPVRLICLCHYVCHHLQFPNACNPNPHQAELAFQTSECLAKKERSAALVASYEQAVKMGRWAGGSCSIILASHGSHSCVCSDRVIFYSLLHSRLTHPSPHLSACCPRHNQGRGQVHEACSGGREDGLPSQQRLSRVLLCSRLG
jgi:hypothetical protein